MGTSVWYNKAYFCEKTVAGTVIRFRHAFARANDLRDAVNKGCLRVAGLQGVVENGEQFTLSDPKRRSCLKDNLDLVVDDMRPEEISGQFMMVLRSLGFPQEQAEIAEQ